VTLEQAKDVAAILGAAIALAALVKGVYEYGAQGAQKRAEQFFVLRKRLFENATFVTICGLLREESPELATCPFQDKYDFLALFEEVALMMNSRLIREPVAHYMFGYYAILCWESDPFWTGLTRDSDYWKVFAAFAATMKRREERFKYSNRQLRF
jgi:hypothetical protein